MRQLMIGGALHFLPDAPGGPDFAQRMKAARLTQRDLERFAMAAYPELKPYDAIRAYYRDVERAQGRPSNAVAGVRERFHETIRDYPTR